MSVKFLSRANVYLGNVPPAFLFEAVIIATSARLLIVLVPEATATSGVTGLVIFTGATSQLSPLSLIYCTSIVYEPAGINLGLMVNTLSAPIGTATVPTITLALK